MPIVWSKNLAEKGKIAIWEISESDEELYNMLQLDEKERVRWSAGSLLSGGVAERRRRVAEVASLTITTPAC